MRKETKIGKKVWCCLLILTMILGLSQLLVPSDVLAQPIKWKMSTTWAPSVQLIELDRHFVELVRELIGDKMQIEFYEGGTIIPQFQILEAVAGGTLDAAGDWAGYWAGKDSAFSILGAHPFGLTGIDYMVWIQQGGGYELFQEAYSKFGVVYLPYAVTPMESGVRSNKPINSLVDYKGLKIRMSGQIQGMILKDIGAAQTVIASAEIYQAMQKGVIDAIESFTPSLDWLSGFGEITKFWCTPGWHAPGAAFGVLINKKSWDILPSNIKAALKTCAMANISWGFSFFEHQSIDGTKKFLDKGIKVTRLSDKDLAQLEKFTNERTLQMCKENPLFAKIAYSQFKYMKDISTWRKYSTPFTYGRNSMQPPDLEAIKRYIK